jgi:predicted phage tail protein
MIRDIYLHGAPGRLYGRHFRLDVASPAEAVRALMTLRPPLRQLLRVGYWRVVVGPPHLANAIEPELLNMRMGSQPLHIVPATGAAGGGGIGKAVAGIALVGASVLTAGLAAPAGVGLFAALGASTGFLGTTFGGIALMGASMALSGVASLLTTPPGSSMGDQTPQATQMAAPGDQPSFLFNGVTNNSQQGGPVPLVFGTHLVGSIVVYAGLDSGDIAP